MLSSQVKAGLSRSAEVYARQIDGAAAYLATRGISRDTAIARMLGYVAEPEIGHEQYLGRLVIPYVTPTGVVDLRYRALIDDGSPKYLSRAGAEPLIYGVEAFHVDSSVIAICEGEMDSIIAWNECGIPSVGIPGAQAWKSYYWRAFEDYDRVLLFADGDAAGRDMAKKVAGSLSNVVVINMPEGEDVNSTFMYEGSDGIRKRCGL